MKKTILMFVFLGLSLAPLKAFGEYLLGAANWGADTGGRAGSGAIRMGVVAGKASLEQAGKLFNHVTLQAKYPRRGGS